MQQWNTVSQELTRRGVEVDYLNATINGLRRMLKEDAQRGVARDPGDVKRFNAELDENERLLKQRQDEVVELRRQIEIGRAQIGIGDARYQNDAQSRACSSATRSSARCSSPRRAGAAADAQRYAAQGAPARSSRRAPSRTSSSQQFARARAPGRQRASASSRTRSRPSA